MELFTDYTTPITISNKDTGEVIATIKVTVKLDFTDVKDLSENTKQLIHDNSKKLKEQINSGIQDAVEKVHDRVNLIGMTDAEYAQYKKWCATVDWCE